MFYVCSMTGVHILWFRNDLRVHDHAPLRAACLAATRDGGQIVPLFISPPDMPHSAFLVESLKDLDAALAQRGAALHFRTGDPVAILSDLHRAQNVLSVYTHDLAVPDASDSRVAAWCMRAGVALRTFSQVGPDAALRPGESHAEAWDQFMASPRHEAPAELPAAQIGIGQQPVAPATATDPEERPEGGRRAAIALLKRLLGRVSELEQIAAPDAHRQATYFDQLAPYLNLGVISLKETWQASVTARNQYLSAGQDIRAARVTELIRKLPSFYLARAPRMPAPTRERASEGRSDDSAQLSLDLRQSGTH